MLATALPEPFTWAHDHIHIDLGGGAHALFTTRRGGVATGPYASLDLAIGEGEHDPDAVQTNYARLAGQIGVPRERIVQGRQVHEATVGRVEGPDGIAEATDGHATATPRLPLLVLTADCLPVALAADGAVAMLHAGWRGLAAGILAEGVAALREVGGAGPVTAAIGPGAGPCCYEVGDEVRTAFADVPGAAQGRHVDLKAVATAQLRDAGVAHIHDTGLCTMCSDPALFFSHRRDAGVTGRQAGVAWRS
ncbi:MAG: peptidoglycan editing factor PgeF [Solirubrobacteraceae bacterium]|nr:peptidoglycan editing factor PgeF [Solirubrobacteraceae bacterium]